MSRATPGTTAIPTSARLAELEDAGRAAHTAEQLTTSLAAFERAGWHTWEPVPLEWNWHKDAICEHLEAVGRGQISRLLVNVPPRHGKSSTCSVAFPAWMWALDPSRQILCGSKESLLARDLSSKCRLCLESPWYQSLFVRGRWRLREDKNRLDEYGNTAHGVRKTVTVGSQTIGFGGQLIIVDDPQDINSGEADREAANLWVRELLTRFNDPRATSFVVIQQRLHDRDASGMLLDLGGWEHLVLPTHYAPKRWSYSTALGCYDKRAKEGAEPGTLLWPERFTPEVITERKRILGASFSGQFDEDPVDPGEAVFKRSAWRFWRRADEPDASARRPLGCWQGPALVLPALESELITVDAAFTDTTTADRVAMQHWGAVGARRFLLRRQTCRLDFTSTVRALAALCTLCPHASAVLVEEKANGHAIVNVLKAAISGLNPDDAKDIVRPTESKVARAHACSPQVNAGDVYLPESAPWLEEYLAELERFPRAPHDDDVDATTMALNYLHTRGDALARLMALCQW